MCIVPELQLAKTATFEYDAPPFHHIQLIFTIINLGCDTLYGTCNAVGFLSFFIWTLYGLITMTLPKNLKLNQQIQSENVQIYLHQNQHCVHIKYFIVSDRQKYMLSNSTGLYFDYGCGCIVFCGNPIANQVSGWHSWTVNHAVGRSSLS